MQAFRKLKPPIQSALPRPGLTPLELAHDLVERIEQGTKFAWRSLWVLMEEGQYKFYRLRDELTYYIASTPPEELDQAMLRERFDQYQAIWDLVGNSWLKYRQADKAN